MGLPEIGRLQGELDVLLAKTLNLKLEQVGPITEALTELVQALAQRELDREFNRGDYHY